jgi:HEAT repeat protein
MLNIAALPTTRSDKARPLFWEMPGLYIQWIEAVDILGEMRATEAIDTLVACLDCNDGPSSLGLGHFPAALSLIKFGDLAIPKLEVVLRQNPGRNRSRAAMTLAEIGGEKAKSILLEILKTETDKSVTDVIENILLGWNASRSSKG